MNTSDILIRIVKYVLYFCLGVVLWLAVWGIGFAILAFFGIMLLKLGLLQFGIGFITGLSISPAFNALLPLFKDFKPFAKFKQFTNKSKKEG